MSDRCRDGTKGFVSAPSADPDVHSNDRGLCTVMDLGGTDEQINEEHLEELLRVTPKGWDTTPNWAHVTTQVVLEFTSYHQAPQSFRV